MPKAEQYGFEVSQSKQFEKCGTIYFHLVGEVVPIGETGFIFNDDPGLLRPRPRSFGGPSLASLGTGSPPFRFAWTRDDRAARALVSNGEAG